MEKTVATISPKFTKVKGHHQMEMKSTHCDSPDVIRKKQAVFVRKSSSWSTTDSEDKPAKKMPRISTKASKESLLASLTVTPSMKKHIEVEMPQKVRRKTKKKKSKISSSAAKKDHLEEAISYLQLWHSDRKAWSFRKKLQSCLLDSMFDHSKVKRADFKILLLYLEGLQGGVRERTIERSCAIVEGYDSDGSGSNDENGDGGAVDKYQYKRAVKVMRVLA